MDNNTAQLLLSANVRMRNPELGVTVGFISDCIEIEELKNRHDCAKEWDLSCKTCQHDLEIINNDL